MKIFHTDTFSSELKLLPLPVRKLYKKQESLFLLNWKDPRLHTKKLRKNNYIFSFRVTRRYRVLFLFRDERTVFFTSIGHRKDIYE